MNCEYWKDCNKTDGGCCSLGLFGGAPSFGVCSICDTNTTKGIWPKINITINNQPVSINNLLPLPFEKWPRLIKLISKKKKEQDRGIGDTIERLIGVSNSEKFKKWYKKIMREDCNCGDRQAKLNVRYPYKKDMFETFPKEKAE